MNIFIIFFIFPLTIFANAHNFEAENGSRKTDLVLNHSDCKEFSKFNINIKNISENSSEYEVWHSEIGADSCTPKHKHNVEEVFVFIEGEGKVTIGDEEYNYKSPCTVVLPANIEHQIFNTGDTPTRHIVILEKHSLIYNKDGNIMNLPWRN